MQRQSLGSPGSKLHIHGGTSGATAGEEGKRKGSGAEEEDAAAAETKVEKPIRSGVRPERSIHLIPVLTILCLLVLYLCSHEPSPKDLASVGAAGGILAAKAVSGAERGGVSAAVRSHRGLKEAEKRRRHRKLGIL